LTCGSALRTTAAASRSSGRRATSSPTDGDGCCSPPQHRGILQPPSPTDGVRAARRASAGRVCGGVAVSFRLAACFPASRGARRAL
jgi:hypothetical protein